MTKIALANAENVGLGILLLVCIGWLGWLTIDRTMILEQQNHSTIDCVDVPAELLQPPYKAPRDNTPWKDYSFSQAALACIGFCKVKGFEPLKAIPTGNGCLCRTKDCKRSKQLFWNQATIYGRVTPK
jgi:hypothetical protein